MKFSRKATLVKEDSENAELGNFEVPQLYCGLLNKPDSTTVGHQKAYEANNFGLSRRRGLKRAANAALQLEIN